MIWEAEYMYSINDLYEMLHKIESLIRENTDSDGTPGFDVYRVMVSLELARRMVANEEKET